MSTTENTRRWREALTPHSRASRRRWTAFYALLLAAIGVGTLDATVSDAVSDDGRGLLTLVVLIVVFGMLRRGTRRLTATDHPELDERDRHARDRAFRLAMPLFVLVVVATVVALPAALDVVDRAGLADGRRSVELYSPAEGWFISVFGLLGLIVWFVLWAVFLPTGVLAWREPDAPLDDESPSPGLPETTRDAILGGAVATGAVLSTAGLGFVGLLVVVGAVLGLTAAARRGGAPLAVRPRMVAGVVGILVVVVAVGYALGLGFDSTSDAPDGSRTASASARLPDGVTRWTSQYKTTCLVVRAQSGRDIGRRDARARMRRLGLDSEELCRF